MRGAEILPKVRLPQAGISERIQLSPSEKPEQLHFNCFLAFPTPGGTGKNVVLLPLTGALY